MSGNDIVDMAVAATESNWRRKGYLQKIFTPQEQEYISDSLAPDETVWRLWTMKESAYKIYTRQYGGRFFAPQKFSCTLLNKTKGIVAFNNNSYQTVSIKAKGFIYSLASVPNPENTAFINSCFALPEADLCKQQAFIYNKIIACYHTITGAVKKNLAVHKDKNGIPFLYCAGNLQIPVSITHHGSFAAFTIN